MSISFFPYEFRKNQKEAIDFITNNIKTNICLDAPTGFGKTPVILSSLLNLSKKKGFKIIWAVKTGNETDRPIEELKIMNERLKKRVFGISYRGKKDMCLFSRDMGFHDASSDDVAYLCKTKRKECKYYSNMMSFGNDDFKKLIQKPITYSELLDFAEKHEICPYELQKALMSIADIISLNYNFIVNESLSWGIKYRVPFFNTFLVVDEAHNLQYVASNLNSSKISIGSVRSSLKELEHFNDKNTERVKSFLLAMLAEMIELRDNMKTEEDEFNIEKFLKSTAIPDKEFLSIFDIMKRYGSRLRKEQISKGKLPHSSLFHMANFWLSAIGSLNTRGIVFIVTKIEDGLVIEKWDMRAAEVLRDKWKEHHSCIFCSGTLNPIDAFAETIGLNDYTGKHFPFEYDQSKVTSLITKDLTTKGKILSREMAIKYVETIDKFLKRLNQNTAIFSASYRIQSDLLKVGLKKIVLENNREFFLEKQGMHGREARHVLDGFKSCAIADRKGVLCATMTGRFAEGADFPGEELVGIFLVGIPFDRMSIRTKLYLEYYKTLYGKTKGVYYGYIVPAMRRVSQSLGRALRSKEDTAVFVCGDERYAENRFFRLLPDFVKNECKVVNFRDFEKHMKLIKQRNY